jgi:HK97 family phage major capsid protein
MDSLAQINERLKQMEGRNDFARALQLIAKHRNYHDALGEAQASATPRVQRYLQTRLKTAVAGGTTRSSTWAQDWAEVRPVIDEFMSLLSQQELIGRIPFTRVPFDTATIKETTPASAGWVGEGSAILASKPSLDKVTLGHSKMGGFFVVTKDLAKIASAASLSNLQSVFLSIVRRTSDEQLINPDVAAVADKNPASLTNGASQVVSTGSTEALITANLKSLLQVHVNAGSDLTNVYLVMHPSTALHMSQLLTAGNVKAYPSLGVRGGEIFGVPVFTSVGAVCSGSPTERVVAAINAPACLLADDGQIEMSASDTVAIQMDDAATGSSSSGTGTSVTALWQTESVAVKFTRWVNFARSFDTAVSYMRVAY